jgi:hypothetical protein
MQAQEKLDAIRQRCVEVNPSKKGDVEIRLSDILLAINEVRPGLRANCSAQGRFSVWDDRTQSHMPAAIWHLRRDSLAEQSKGTVDFVYNLLWGHV